MRVNLRFYHHPQQASTALRDMLLARYGEVSTDWHVEKDRFGKPYVTGSKMAMRVSVSHSHLLGLCALGDGGNLGVDIEHLGRRLPTLTSLLDCVPFEDRHRLLGMDATKRRRWFLERWVCIEAALKADGHGLLIDPRACSVYEGASRHITIVEGHESSWRVASFFLHGHVGAVAIAGNTNRDTHVTIQGFGHSKLFLTL